VGTFTRRRRVEEDDSTATQQGWREEGALADLEVFELADFAGIAERRRRQQNEMKFSHSIQFNAVPDWSSHYIAYSNLKKL
jgi:hypothetical protein